MSIPKIEDLEELLSQYIEKSKKIVDTKISRLTAPGENYGSEMLKVDVVLKDEETNKEEDLNVVAKLIPTAEFFRTLFNVQVTFKNEKEFYNTIVPTLHQFQRKQGVTETIDCFPKFYGARANLEYNNGPVDDNAVLILENLKTKGYINVDRFEGFDLYTTKLLLRDIAQFHAVSLALKLKDPHTFEEKVKVYSACFHPAAPNPPFDHGPGPILLAQLEEKDTVRHLLPILKASLKHFGKVTTTFREPFATIVHADLWVNNIMIRLEDDRAIDRKIVDFQMYTYDSPAADLLFFLWTSVETTTLQAHFDDFLKYYHSVFVKTLESLKCDTAPFSYDLFMEEMAATADREVAHTFFMLAFVVHGKKGGPPEGDPSKPPKLEELTIELKTKEKMWWILEECGRRSWPSL